MAILRDMPRTATVRAVTAATLMTLERDAFREMVAQSLGTTSDFDRVIQQRLSELGLTARPSDVRQ
jgi:CRP-like cAMP-binding protein